MASDLSIAAGHLAQAISFLGHAVQKSRINPDGGRTLSAAQAKRIAALLERSAQGADRLSIELDLRGL